MPLLILSVSCILALALPLFLLLLNRRLGLSTLVLQWGIGVAILAACYVMLSLSAGFSVPLWFQAYRFLTWLPSYLFGSAIPGAWILPRSLEAARPPRIHWVLIRCFIAGLLVGPLGYDAWAFASAYSQEPNKLTLFLSSYLFMFVSPQPWLNAVVVTLSSAVTLNIMKKRLRRQAVQDIAVGR